MSVSSNMCVGMLVQVMHRNHCLESGILTEVYVTVSQDVAIILLIFMMGSRLRMMHRNFCQITGIL